MSIQNEGPTAVVSAADTDEVKHPAGDERGLIGWLLGVIPTAIVMAVLVGIAYWGHHTDWKFLPPKPPEQTGSEWCERHNVTASQCVECNPELLPKPPTFGWCDRHGVYDCPFEHPEVAQLLKPGKVTAVDLERAEKALQSRKRPANDPDCARQFRRIQFVSANAVEKAGITVETALALGIIETVVASAEVGYEETSLTRLPARAAGIARRVLKKEGESVVKGEVLAVIDAAEVGKTKAEFVQALVQTRQRRRLLADLKGVAEMLPAQVREAEADVREAEIRLRTSEDALANFGLRVRAGDFEKVGSDEASVAVRLAGLPAAAAEGLNPKTATANLMAVVSPRDGIVLKRDVVAGEFVGANKLLFVVGVVDRVWVNLHVPPPEVPLLAVGQMVRFQPDGTSGDYPEAKLTWVGTEADRKTRTVPARAELENKKGEVRAGTFGVARVVLRDEPDALVVPKEAVHFNGRCYLVFVRDKDYLKPDTPKVFHPRMVRIGANDGVNIEIIAGLLTNELVAAKGSSLLMKELQRNITPVAERRGR